MKDNKIWLLFYSSQQADFLERMRVCDLYCDDYILSSMKQLGLMRLLFSDTTIFRVCVRNLWRAPIVGHRRRVEKRNKSILQA